MGKNTELVLYDFLADPKAMIADIRNGHLSHGGAFLVTKSGNRICALLDISKYTLYSYLDIIRI
ncbi:MAG: transcriptional regulator [Lachnospiraceae bacterium]|jgi:predicted transcriptional regulator YheO|nr:transcriptional regulator [Lachnospiraceae bacterium]